MDAKTLTYQLGFTAHTLKKNTEDITHEDSLVHPDGGGSSINWVLGHIVKSRNLMLNLLNQDPASTAEALERYSGDADAGWDNDTAIPFDELLAAFDNAQPALTDALQAASAAHMSAKAPFSPIKNPDETIGSLLAALVFHEAYHVGQTGSIRRVAGKPGVLSPPA